MGIIKALHDAYIQKQDDSMKINEVMAEGSNSREKFSDLKAWAANAKQQGLRVVPANGDSDYSYWAVGKGGEVFGKFVTTHVPQNSHGYIKKQGVAEGSLKEFAPDGFNGGDDDDGFDPKIAEWAQEDGFTKGASLVDGATLEQAMAINYWHKQQGGIYKQYFAKGFKAGRMDKINFNNKQYNLNLKLMKDGSIRHGEQGMAEGSYDNDPGINHTRGSLVAKLEALPKGSDDFEWNRIQAIHHLKQGNMLRAKYYMSLMKRG
jgi:hypothetical protein